MKLRAETLRDLGAALSGSTRSCSCRASRRFRCAVERHCGLPRIPHKQARRGSPLRAAGGEGAAPAPCSRSSRRRAGRGRSPGSDTIMASRRHYKQHEEPDIALHPPARPTRQLTTPSSSGGRRGPGPEWAYVRSQPGVMVSVFWTGPRHDTLDGTPRTTEHIYHTAHDPCVGLSATSLARQQLESLFLKRHGYFRIVPGQPARRRWRGEPPRPEDVSEPVDIVNVFRAPEALPAIARETVAIWEPRSVFRCPFGASTRRARGSPPRVPGRDRGSLLIEHAHYVGRISELTRSS